MVSVLGVGQDAEMTTNLGAHDVSCDAGESDLFRCAQEHASMIGGRFVAAKTMSGREPDLGFQAFHLILFTVCSQFVHSLCMVFVHTGSCGGLNIFDPN